MVSLPGSRFGNGSLRATTLIGQMRNQLKMLRVPAQSVVAQVVHLFLAGDVPKEMGKAHQMSRYSEAIQAHTSVATPSAIARGAPLPNEARTGTTSNDVAQINDGGFGR